jgi:hypothetical protein
MTVKNPLFPALSLHAILNGAANARRKSCFVNKCQAATPKTGSLNCFI